MRKFFVALALLGVSGASAAAQQNQQLTLDEALAIARARNPAYRQAQARFSSAAASVRSGFGSMLPQISARTTFAGASRTTVTGEDDFGEPIDLPNPITFRSSSVSQAISANMTLFDGFRNINRLRAARGRANAAEFGIQSALVTLEGEVTRRFYDAVRSLRLIEVEQQLFVSAQGQLDATERLFRIAGATQVDVLGAQVDVSRQELAVERARGNSRRSFLRLEQQIGINPGTDVSVVGDFPEPFDPAELNPDSLVARARRNSPRVSQLEANAGASRSQATATRGGRWPTVSAGVDFSRAASLNDYDAFFRLNPRNRSFRFNLSVQIPIFDGFSTSSLIAEADMSAIIAEEDLREGILQVEQQVRSAVIDLENTYEALQVELRALELSRRQLGLAQQQYRLGAINFTNLQTVRERAAQAERRAVNAEYDLAAALATLEEAVGEDVR